MTVQWGGTRPVTTSSLGQTDVTRVLGAPLDVPNLALPFALETVPGSATGPIERWLREDEGWQGIHSTRPWLKETSNVEYLVTMTTHVPDGTSEAAVDEIRNREAVRSRELAAGGHLLRLWRPPLGPGEWRTIGLFSAEDRNQLEEVLLSMPLRVWRTDEVMPLSPHPNDPMLTEG